MQMLSLFNSLKKWAEKFTVSTKIVWGQKPFRWQKRKMNPFVSSRYVLSLNGLWAEVCTAIFVNVAVDAVCAVDFLSFVTSFPTVPHSFLYICVGRLLLSLICLIHVNVLQSVLARRLVLRVDVVVKGIYWMVRSQFFPTGLKSKPLSHCFHILQLLLLSLSVLILK